MRLRSLTVMAMLAALVGAPPSASAATNILHAPAATPTAGTVGTSFRLHVEYRGTFRATSVKAELVAVSVPMTLVAGSPRDGAWEASVTLPPGTWPLTFGATAERGNNPSLDGPVITVSHSTAVPTGPFLAPATTESGDSRTPDREFEDVDGADDTRTPGAEGAAGQTTAPGDGQSGSQAGTVAPSGQDSDTPAARSSPTGGTGRGAHDDGEAARAGDGESGANAGDASPEASPASGPTGAAASGVAQPQIAPSELDAGDGGEPRAMTDEIISTAARLTGAWAAALLVVVALVIGFLVRRRRRTPAEAEATSVAASADAILRRRALRRARRPMADDDPIIASLGLDQNERPSRTARRLPSPGEDPD